MTKKLPLRFAISYFGPVRILSKCRNLTLQNPNYICRKFDKAEITLRENIFVESLTLRKNHKAEIS